MEENKTTNNITTQGSIEKRSLEDIIAEETTSRKFLNAIKSNIIFILLAIVSIVYITSCTIKLEKNTDILQVIITSAITLLIGWIIKFLCRKQGITKGYNSKKYIKAQEYYDNLVLDNNKYSEYYNAYCDVVNEERMINYQKKILTLVNLKYDKYLLGEYDNLKTYKNINGENIEFTKKQIKALKKLRNPKILIINEEYLTNMSAIVIDEDRKEETQHAYEGKRGGLNAMSMALTCIIFGSYTASFILGNTLAHMIYNTLQISIFLAWGAVEYFKAYSWVVNNNLFYLNRRIELLSKFRNMYDNKNSKLWAKVKEIQDAQVKIQEIKNNKNDEGEKANG